MILFCFGTRPEWLKIKPITDLLKISDRRILFTNQHRNLITDVQFDYEIKMTESVDRLNQVISDCLVNFPKENYSTVIVQGDTASAFACALSAFNRKLKIVHIEAGLRSHDLNNPFPEEGFRQMISRISTYHFCPTELSRKNLIEEGISKNIFVVGNTSLDNLINYKEHCSYENKILVTLHRRENHEYIKDWFNIINHIASKNKNLEFIFPIHPNPDVIKHKNILNHVSVIDPMSHSDMIKVLTKCKFVITDSGGIQEESSFFNKKAIVCRKTTERPEGITSGHLHLCPSPSKLIDLFYFINSNFKINVDCPFGDGFASKKIISILKNENLF